jgi:hypothetical protein
MFRATDRFLSAWTNLPDPEGRQSRLLHDEASRSCSSPPWLVADRFAAEARKTKLHRLGALNNKPDCLNPAYPKKTAFRFPPEVILGGFLLIDELSRDHVVSPELVELHPTFD